MRGILKSMLGIQGYDIISVAESEGVLQVQIETPRAAVRCPHCGSEKVEMQGRKLREVRALPYGSCAVILQLKARRMRCLQCGRHPMERFTFCQPRKRHTLAVAKAAMQDAERMTIKESAAKYGLRWHTLRDEMLASYRAQVETIDLSSVRRVNIDEIYVRKGVFMTVVMDYDTKRILHVGEGRNEQSLAAFWEAARKQNAHFEVFSMDLAHAYTASVKKHQPSSEIVFDSFHLMRLINRGLDSLRLALGRELKAKLQSLSVGMRELKRILLRNPEGKPLTRRDRRILEELFKASAVIERAYHANEAFRAIFKQATVEAAERAFASWVAQAKRVGERVYDGLVRTMERSREGIIAYCKHPISSGRLEGMNNKIRVYIRRAYGFRDMIFLKYRILTINRVTYT